MPTSELPTHERDEEGTGTSSFESMQDSTKETDLPPPGGEQDSTTGIDRAPTTGGDGTARGRAAAEDGSRSAAAGGGGGGDGWDNQFGHQLDHEFDNAYRRAVSAGRGPRAGEDAEGGGGGRGLEVDCGGSRDAAAAAAADQAADEAAAECGQLLEASLVSVVASLPE